MRKTLIGILTFSAFFVALPALAAGVFEFQPIISQGALPLPTSATSTLCDYLNAVFKLSITIAVVLAVIMIVIDGFKYMTSEMVTKKGQALAGIRSALGGLILLLASYMILFIINPQILSLSVFSPNGGTLGGCRQGGAAAPLNSGVSTPVDTSSGGFISPSPLNVPLPDAFQAGTGSYCFGTTLGNTFCFTTFNECDTAAKDPTYYYTGVGGCIGNSAQTNGGTANNGGSATSATWCYVAAPNNGTPTTICSFQGSTADSSGCTAARAADQNHTGFPCYQQNQ